MFDEDRFCPRCATPLELKEVQGVERPTCPSCDKIVYYDPKVTAGAVVERDGKVLMVRRGNEPGIGLWSLPGGYVDRGEDVEGAAKREVMEETGLKVEVTEVVGVYSQPGHPVILIIYDSRIVGGDPEAGPEVMELGFFPPEDLPPLAFERDRYVLASWRKLRDGHCHGSVTAFRLGP